MIPSLLKKRPTGPGWVCKPKGHVITTQHLTLRTPKYADADAIRATLDDDVVYWQGFKDSINDLDREAQEISNRTLRRRPFSEWWLICDQTSDEVVGCIAISMHKDNYDACDVGLWLKERWRGRGLGKEALANVINLISHIGFETAYACTRTDNEKAIKLFTKLGFARQKTEAYELPNGYLVPSLWLKLDVPKAAKSRCDLR
jgi:RimJ/RimL family protein N-acetyltransferase